MAPKDAADTEPVALGPPEARGVLGEDARDQRPEAARGVELLPRVNEDLPPPYALQFENAVRVPGVILNFRFHFVFIHCVDDQERAAFVNQRSSHQDKAFLGKLIDELRVFIPERLLTRAL
ncbi:MAG TPA: hypothetical protein VGT00_19480 [Methylomirabilota bacterium]|nr:hypothetical protein [Methylomirabilota bacterium]